MYEKMFQLQEEVFKVLANQKRLEIIQLLSSHELCVSDMIDMLGLPQANLSQHLSLMRRTGLIESTRRGTKIYYRLTDTKIAELVFAVRDMWFNHEQLSDEAKQYFDLTSEIYPVVNDIVCGMRLSAARSSCRVDYEDQAYFFCASGCQEKFVKNPLQYIHGKSHQRDLVNG